MSGSFETPDPVNEARTELADFDSYIDSGGPVNWQVERALETLRALLAAYEKDHPSTKADATSG